MKRQTIALLTDQTQLAISHLAELLLLDPGQLHPGHTQVKLDCIDLQPQPRVLRLGLLPELMSV